MSATDVLVFTVVLFALGIGLLVAHFAFSSMTDEITGISAVNESTAAVDAFNSAKTLSDRFDYVIFMVFVGLVIGIIVSGWYVGGEPIFMAMYFIVVVVAVAISTVLSNAYEDVSTNATFLTTLSHFPITSHLLAYLPYYVAVIGIIGVTVMFGKAWVGRA